MGNPNPNSDTKQPPPPNPAQGDQGEQQIATKAPPPFSSLSATAPCRVTPRVVPQPTSKVWGGRDGQESLHDEEGSLFPRQQLFYRGLTHPYDLKRGLCKGALLVYRTGGFIALGLRFFFVPVVFFGIRAIFWFLGFSPIQGVNEVEKRLRAQNDKLLGEEEGDDEVVWGGWAESKIYSSMASIELPDVSAEDAFDFLSHHENNSLWHKNICEVEIDPESPVKWGLGTKYLQHGKIAFLPSYKTTRYMTVTKFDSSSTTKVMEQTESSPLTSHIYTVTISPSPTGCTMTITSHVSLCSSIVCWIIRSMFSKDFVQETFDGIVDEFCVQAWHAFDDGIDLCRAMHKGDQILL